MSTHTGWTPPPSSLAVDWVMFGFYLVNAKIIEKCIGVNRPAIVREIPHFGLFPAFPHFFQNIPHFWLYFEINKIAENGNTFGCTEKFCSKKLCENVSYTVIQSLKLYIYFWPKKTSKTAENSSNCHCRRHFVRKSSAKTSVLPSLVTGRFGQDPFRPQFLAETSLISIFHGRFGHKMWTIRPTNMNVSAKWIISLPRRLCKIDACPPPFCLLLQS